MRINKPKVYKKDARKLHKIITNELVDVTITSPPYYDMKDYGYQNQIGFGQSYDAYLEDLKLVFEKVFNATKETGSLWVIIDTFKKDGEMIPLPFHFADKLKEVGWKLQEVIIWGKDRTVPWAHKGQMRNLFEYILFFTKTQNFNFYIDKVRETETLKKWWVKYPERYNPKGKSPSAIWDFDIPTQGSWGNGYIKHFCPLPEGLIEQILKLSSQEGDLILDPFTGSGAVPSKAHSMKRQFIGCELNQDYIKMFEEYFKNTKSQKREEYERNEANTKFQSDFEKLILDLRILKFGRLLIQKVQAYLNDPKIRIFVEPSSRLPQGKNRIVSANYYLFTEQDEGLIHEIETYISKAPLSKFGIDYQMKFIKGLEEINDELKSFPIFTYTGKNTHHFNNKVNWLNLMSELKESDIVLSNLRLDLNEKDYE